jgi:hypothetical protein
MPRGRTSPVGAVTINANGYSQTKVENGKWVGTHQLILEEKIGRKLLPGERAIFADGNKENLSPDNIELNKTSVVQSTQARIAKLTAEIEDRLALIKELESELERMIDEETD